MCFPFFGGSSGFPFRFSGSSFIAGSVFKSTILEKNDGFDPIVHVFFITGAKSEFSIFFREVFSNTILIIFFGFSLEIFFGNELETVEIRPNFRFEGDINCFKVDCLDQTISVLILKNGNRIFIQNQKHLFSMEHSSSNRLMFNG